MLQDIFEEVPPEKDEYLTEFEAEAKMYVRAGLDLCLMSVSAKTDREEAGRHLKDAIKKLPPEFGRAVERRIGNE